MRKGSHHTEETKILLKVSNRESAKRAVKIRYENYNNKYPKRKENPYLNIKARNLNRDFGILLSEYDAIFEKQNGCCAICGLHQDVINNKKSLGVDHDHKTGKIRGLLCDKCNRGLGLFNDDIYLLANAKDYLKTSTSAFLDDIEIKKLGLKVGSNVLISRKASFYGSSEISIGNNVRIDDFCILSGNITLGNNIHIGAYCGLYGKFGIVMEDYTGLSPRCTIFSASDDFGGNFLISPMNPAEYCNVTGGEVVLRKFVQIGAGTIIMPLLTIFEGAAIGAMSFVKHNVEPWEIWVGNPLHYIKERQKGMIKYAL